MVLLLCMLQPLTSISQSKGRGRGYTYGDIEDGCDYEEVHATIYAHQTPFAYIQANVGKQRRAHDEYEKYGHNFGDANMNQPKDYVV